MVAERTTLAFVAQNIGGIPDFLFYRGADTKLRPEDVPDDLIRETAFLHLSSLALLAEPSGSATLSAAERASGRDTLVSVDPNLRPSSWASVEAIRASVAPLLAAADVLKVNDEEARLLTGEEDMKRALSLMGREDSLAIVTLGPEGCLWQWQGKSGSASSPRVEVVETTGAGDAFVGAVLAELCRHGYTGERFQALDTETVAEIARFACAAGALACTAPGAMASLPTRPEVEDLLRAAAPEVI
jgi:fructokinase